MLQKDNDFTPTTGFPTRDTAFQRRETPVLSTGTSSTVWYCDTDKVADGQEQQPAGQATDHKPPEFDNHCFSVPASTRVSRRNKRKESKHYQESDILESPSVYCRSTLVDKISDYEDIWTQDASNKGDRRSLLGQRHAIFGQEDLTLKTFSPIPKDVRQRSCMNISHTTATTPAGTPVTLEDAIGGGQEQKQTSPFYADPADILSNIIRRSPLNRLASSNSSQRHSEPPKQLFGHEDTLCSSTVHPWGNGNGYNVAASLDELALEKNDTMLSGVRMHELSIAGTNDYDSDIRWKTPTTSLKTIEPTVKPHQKSTESLMGCSRPTTIHQIIAKKLPALNLSERLLDGMLANDSGIGTGTGESGFGTLGNRGQRKSAYDNVEKQANAYASSAINSAHSDDGTVFSEPWDSSQWDSFLPNEQSTLEVVNMGNSGYDNSSSVAKENRYRKDVHQPQLPQSQQKVATILRSRSCRDREILCK
uniref:Uncharacterized protein n=1 Tax=Anopheles maculatus TaxID=74869 RepID=A0A182SM45_9DIPT